MHFFPQEFAIQDPKNANAWGLAGGVWALLDLTDALNRELPRMLLLFSLSWNEMVIIRQAIPSISIVSKFRNRLWLSTSGKQCNKGNMGSKATRAIRQQGNKRNKATGQQRQQRQLGNRATKATGQQGNEGNKGNRATRATKATGQQGQQGNKGNRATRATRATGENK